MGGWLNEWRCFIKAEQRVTFVQGENDVSAVVCNTSSASDGSGLRSEPVSPQMPVETEVGRGGEQHRSPYRNEAR